MNSVTLGQRELRPFARPYIIAEIGVNHEGVMETALRLIELAKEGGADAAKFQTYKADKLAARVSPSYWDLKSEPTTSQRELFKKYDMFGPEEYRQLAAHCRKVGIEFVSTPFDLEAVDLLDPLMSFYKIASADLTNVPLLRKVASRKKPVVLSTGAATVEEIRSAVRELKTHGAPAIVLLHCVLNYPTPMNQAHINMIAGLQKEFPEHVVGYSDHTVPEARMLVLTAAWIMGAIVLEKHFTHDKTLPGNDHYHAMDVHDLKNLNANVDLLMTVGGDVEKRPLDSETPARQHARRSIVTIGEIPQGALLTNANLTTKRPAHGISPLSWDEIVGRHAKRALRDDHILQWDDVV
ncbi:MAG: N-acetylneuraminate synthase family protein [Pseudomonadota bacterium]